MGRRAGEAGALLRWFLVTLLARGLEACFLEDGRRGVAWVSVGGEVCGVDNAAWP